MDEQYNRLVWCINTRAIPRCFGETKMASNNENGIGHLRALVPWLMMMMMMIMPNHLLLAHTPYTVCGTIRSDHYGTVTYHSPFYTKIERIKSITLRMHSYM